MALPRGFEPLLPPWEGGVLTTWPWEHDGCGTRIRTQTLWVRVTCATVTPFRIIFVTNFIITFLLRLSTVFFKVAIIIGRFSYNKPSTLYWGLIIPWCRPPMILIPASQQVGFLLHTSIFPSGGAWYQHANSGFPYVFCGLKTIDQRTSQDKCFL